MYLTLLLLGFHFCFPPWFHFFIFFFLVTCQRIAAVKESVVSCCVSQIADVFRVLTLSLVCPLTARLVQPYMRKTGFKCTASDSPTWIIALQLCILHIVKQVLAWFEMRYSGHFCPSVSDLALFVCHTCTDWLEMQRRSYVCPSKTWPMILKPCVL